MKDSAIKKDGAPAAVNQKKQAVQTAMEQIQKQFGRGAIMMLGDRPTDGIDSIPTGIMSLDTALGIGGIPSGRVVEIFGPEASGKTTVCLSIIAQAQKSGGICAFVDAEHALDPAWAKTLGVNLEDMLISQPDTGEQALEIVEALIRSGGVDLIVVDSIAALVPRAEIEGEMGDSQMGLQARLMSQALRKITGIIAKSKTTVVFTNQLRLKIGIMFGNPETTPGGLAAKFYSSVRMDVRKIETLKKNGEVIGTRVRIKVVKNKMAPPFREAEFTINARGVDRDDSLIDAAVAADVIQKAGSFLKMDDQVLAQGKEQLKETFAKDVKLRAKIVDLVEKAQSAQKKEAAKK